MPKKPNNSRWLYILLGLYVVVSLSYYVGNISAFIDNYFDLHHRAQAPFSFDADSLRITSIELEAGKAGLAAGDVIVTLGGRPYAGQVPWLNLIRSTLHPGDTLKVGVLRPNGSAYTAQVPLMGRTPREHAKFREWGGILLLFGLPPLICLLVGYWVVAARPRDINAWLILGILTFPETLFTIGGGWWPGWWAVWSTIWMQAQQVLSPVALLLFGIYFPERWRLDRRRPWLKYALVAPLVASIPVFTWVLIGEDFHDLWIPAQITINAWTNRIVTLFAVLCITIYFIALQFKYHSGEIAPDAKRRLRVLQIGSEVGLGALFIAFGILPLFHINIQGGSLGWIGIVAGLVFLAFPFSLA
jgi:sigma-B regulation protein RsbU (phosphoserine phosphatase)